MLVAHQLTGEDRWLGRAHELAERSLEWLGNAWTHPNALYKGDLGIALLMEDLADPTGAAMPLFSPEGWPN
jgi:serine/threonine-protein kinase